MSPSETESNRKQKMNHLQLIQFSVDNAAEAIFWINQDGQFIYVNNGAVEHLGYKKEELLGMSVHQIDPNFPADKWSDHWEDARQEKNITFESRHITKTGAAIPVEIRVSHLRVEETEFHCAFVRNISKQKKVEIELLRNESRLRKTLDVTSDGVWDRNLATGEVYYGSKWATVLGYREEDLLSGKITWEKLLHPEDRDRAIQSVRDHIQGKSKNYEEIFRLLNSENKWQWIHARGKIIEYDEDGNPLRFVGTHTDITIRKKAEESLLKRSEETKLFAYSVVHDLKNPAIAIRGLAERFSNKMSELSDDQKKVYCDQILSSSEQIADLVEKINAYISSKETRITVEDFYLKEVIQICRGEFAAQLQYRAIKWDIFPENPLIRADRLSIIRVFRNFIENSLKYGGEKLTKISINYQNTSGYHILSFRDNGVGMKVEDSKNIFQPFERKKGITAQSGSGLGLAIVKEIAHHHKGEVWIEHKCKRGMQFCFAISKNL